MIISAGIPIILDQECHCLSEEHIVKVLTSNGHQNFGVFCVVAEHKNLL